MNQEQLDRHLKTVTEEEKHPLDIYGLMKMYDLFPEIPISYGYSGLLQALDNKQLTPKFQGRLTELVEDFQFLNGIVASKQDRFYPVALHQHDWMELAYMYSGSCTLTIAGKEVSLREHQCVLISQNTPHSSAACGENDILVNFLIRREYLNLNFFQRFSRGSYLTRYLISSMNAQKDTDRFLLFHSEGSRRLPLFVNEFLCEYFERNVHSKDFLDNCFALIFLELTEVYRKDQRQTADGGDDLLLPILRYLEKNWPTCTLKSTAEAFHMNPNYLSGYIRRHTGQTFKSILQENRLLFAQNLLKNTNLPVTEICARAGYANVTFFYKIFAKRFGCTPAQYRSQGGGK